MYWLKCLANRRVIQWIPKPQLSKRQLLTNGGNLSFSKEGVDFSKPLVMSKYTRLEFEQKRWGLSGTELRNLLNSQGSDFDNLEAKHNQHYSVLQKVLHSLRSVGSDVTIVQRGQYTDELINNSSVIFTVGGDGTFLQAASKITCRDKPLIGVNSDPSKSLGILCLPSKFNEDPVRSLRRLVDGKFNWFFRKRIRLTIDHNGTIPCAISLSDEQMKFYNHLEDLRNSVISHRGREQKTVLPIRALNEVYVGEYVASGTSYFEMQVNDDPPNKHKSSGLLVSTGTGSQAWFSSHSKVSNDQIRKLLQISSRYLKSNASTHSHEDSSAISNELTEEQLSEISGAYLREFVHMNPCSDKMLFSIKDPLHNQVFKRPLNLSDRPFREQGEADTLRIHSRLWDGCVIVDGNWAYGFDSGAWITLEILDEDSLRTITLE